jgi:hypothetical protein
MKKAIFLILSICSLQSAGQKHIIGLKGGANRANIYSRNFLDDYKSRRGFAGGLTYEYLYKEHLVYSIEAIYNQRGIVGNIELRDEEGHRTGELKDVKFNYNYISFPLKFGLKIGNKFSALGNFGIIPSILLEAKSIAPVYDSAGGSFVTLTVNVTDKPNKLDLAAFIEFGCSYQLGERFWIYSTFTYQHSIINMANSQYWQYCKMLHNAMTLSFGLKYDITKKPLAIKTQ